MKSAWYKYNTYRYGDVSGIQWKLCVGKAKWKKWRLTARAPYTLNAAPSFLRRMLREKRCIDLVRRSLSSLAAAAPPQPSARDVARRGGGGNLPLAVRSLERSAPATTSLTATMSMSTTTRGWHGRSPLTKSDKVIIYAFGPDRPGLVSALAKAVLDAGGNVEESRMARLGGDFNMMMCVSFASAESLAGDEGGREGEGRRDGGRGSTFRAHRITPRTFRAFDRAHQRSCSPEL